MKTKSEATSNVNIAHSYLRWSSDQQSLGDSERRQLEATKALCAQNGWQLAERVFTDRGVSAWHGANREQGALGELLKEVKPQEIVVLESLDRWSRQDPIDAIDALRTHVDRGVEFYFSSIGKIVNRASYKEVRMMLLMQSEMAAQYSDRLSQRIKAAMQARREKLEKEGVLAFGKLPCWLEWNGPRRMENRKPIVVEAKADVVRLIFDLHLAGSGCGLIAAMMRDSKTPCITNYPTANWNPTFVYKLLRGRSVLGEHAPSKTPGVYPALISEQVFLKAQAKKEGREHQTAHARVKNSNLFAGLATCSRCNHALTKLYSPRNGVKYFYLCCGGRFRRVPGCTCDFSSIPYAKFEDSFVAVLRDSGLIRKMLGKGRSASPIDDLKRKLADVSRRADVLLNALEAGGDEAGRLGKRLNELEAQEKSIKAEIATAEAKAQLDSPAEAFDGFTKLVDDTQSEAGRGAIKNSLADFVHSITVDLNAKAYQIKLKGALMPVTVTFEKYGWCVEPSAQFATGQPVAQEQIGVTSALDLEEA